MLPTSDQEVDLFAEAHCYLAPSKGEGWGLCPHQAIAQGCPTVLTDAVSRQIGIEGSTGMTLREVTEPTETAVSAAFAHTAVLAGQPRNTRQLAAAGGVRA